MNEIVYTDSLMNYMKSKGISCILVELVEISTSDVEIAELHVQFASEKQKKYFMDKKRYYSKKAPYGELLLPPFALECEDTVTFDLKKVLWFYTVKYDGIKVSAGF